MLSSLPSQTLEKPAVVSMKWGECCWWGEAPYLYLTKTSLVRECCARDLSQHFTHLWLTCLLQCRWSYQSAIRRTVHIMTPVQMIVKYGKMTSVAIIRFYLVSTCWFSHPLPSWWYCSVQDNFTSSIWCVQYQYPYTAHIIHQNVQPGHNHCCP